MTWGREAARKRVADKRAARREAARKRRILVVDDEVLIARALARLLRSHYEVDIAESPEGTAPEYYDVVITDWDMPMSDTGKWIVEAQELGARFIVHSGRHPDDIVLADGSRPQWVVYKPADFALLLQAVSEALASRSEK